jgi:hypothetical protein
MNRDRSNSRNEDATPKMGRRSALHARHHPMQSACDGNEQAKSSFLTREKPMKMTPWCRGLASAVLLTASAIVAACLSSCSRPRTFDIPAQEFEKLYDSWQFPANYTLYRGVRNNQHVLEYYFGQDGFWPTLEYIYVIDKAALPKSFPDHPQRNTIKAAALSPSAFDGKLGACAACESAPPLLLMTSALDIAFATAERTGYPMRGCTVTGCTPVRNCWLIRFAADVSASRKSTVPAITICVKSDGTASLCAGAGGSPN